MASTTIFMFITTAAVLILIHLDSARGDDPNRDDFLALLGILTQREVIGRNNQVTKPRKVTVSNGGLSVEGYGNVRFVNCDMVTLWSDIRNGHWDKYTKPHDQLVAACEPFKVEFARVVGNGEQHDTIAMYRYLACNKLGAYLENE